MISVQLDVQYACVDNGALPSLSQFKQWIDTTLQMETNHSVLTDKQPELTVRIVSEEEGRSLNQQWRHRDYPTNVLAFPFDSFPAMDLPLLGDLVICAPVVVDEAAQQQKSLTAHWAHLVIHGTLHLLGYDHQTDAQADIMENLEIQILQQLGYPNPYL